jgi:hypothetical protein
MAARARTIKITTRLWLVALGLLSASTLHAQARSSEQAPDVSKASISPQQVAQSAEQAESAQEKSARAFALLDKALGLIEQKQWTDAKAALEQARGLSEFPNIVFHLARTSYLLQEYPQAARDLDRFDVLAGPNNPNVADARLLREQLLRAGTPLPAHPTATTIDDESPSGVPIGPVLTVAVGGAALIAAVTTGALANAAEGELMRNCDGHRCREELRDVRDNGHLYQIATNVLLSVGAAAVAAGGVWWWLSHSSVSCGPGGGCRGTLMVNY